MKVMKVVMKKIMGVAIYDDDAMQLYYADEMIIMMGVVIYDNDGG